MRRLVRGTCASHPEIDMLVRISRSAMMAWALQMWSCPPGQNCYTAAAICPLLNGRGTTSCMIIIAFHSVA